VHSILPKLPKVRQLVVISDRKAPATGELQFVGEYEELLAAASPDFRFPDFDENVQATTFHTTGTTGLPKGVYYSHRQVVLHVMAELALFGLAVKQGRFHRDDVYMPIAPMFHVHAWGFPWAATLAGVKQVYPGRYDPALLIKLIKAEGVTFTHGVPTILQMLLDAAANANVDLAGLKMLIGGSVLPEELARRALDQGIDVFTGYGMSETGPLVTVAHLQSSDLSSRPTVTCRSPTASRMSSSPAVNGFHRSSSRTLSCAVRGSPNARLLESRTHAGEKDRSRSLYAIRRLRRPSMRRTSSLM
jgi:fatty-acyl-CoA synthase